MRKCYVLAAQSASPPFTEIKMTILRIDERCRNLIVTDQLVYSSSAAPTPPKTLRGKFQYQTLHTEHTIIDVTTIHYRCRVLPLYLRLLAL